MQTPFIGRAVSAASLVVLVAACGGGDSETAGTPGGGLPSGTPSADQQAFEAFAVAPAAGLYQLRWSIALTGTPVSGYIGSDALVLTASPAKAGPQRAPQTTLTNLTRTLTVPALTPSRVLKNGKVLLIPPIAPIAVTSYVGTEVQIDTLASDGVTVAVSQRRSGFTTVALSGTLAAAPLEFQRWHSALYQNPSILEGSTPFVTGAGYLKYTARNVGDRHLLVDCASPFTTGSTPTPCLSGISLELALAAGQLPVTASAGTLTTTDGVPVWISNTQNAAGTPAFVTYYQLNGNVYKGSVILDKTVLYGNQWSTPTSGVNDVPYQIRLNKGAHDTLAAGIKL